VILIFSIHTDNYSRYSLSPFQVVGDSTIIGYSKFLFMTVAMLLRHIDAILAERASDYGPFKLRGVKPQFKAALTLYKLFLTTGGDDLDPQADWAIHNLFQTLLCPEGSNDRTINYPTDQAIFLWAFLSNHRYRISSHVQSLLSAAKYCLRCVSLQIARIQVQGDLDSPFFEEIMPKSGTETEAELEEDDGDDGDISSGGERVAVENTADTGAVLEWLNTRLNSFQNSNEGMIRKYNTKGHALTIFFKWQQCLIPLLHLPMELMRDWSHQRAICMSESNTFSHFARC